MNRILPSLLACTLAACSFNAKTILPANQYIVQMEISQRDTQGNLSARPATAAEKAQWQAWLQQYGSSFRKRGWMEIKVSELPLWCIILTNQPQQTFALCRYAGAYGQLGKIEYGMDGILDHAAALHAADKLIKTSGEQND